VKKISPLLLRFQNYLSTIKLLIKLGWGASPFYFLGLLALIIISGLIPVAGLLVSSLLIDLIIHSVSISQPLGTLPTSLIILLILMGGLNAVGQSITNLRSAVEDLYKKKASNYVSILIAENASLLDLAFFDDPDFHNQLSNASSEASYRPVIMISQLMAAISTLILSISTAILLLIWHWWIIFLILFTSIVTFWVLAHFGTARVKLITSRVPITRKAQYINSLLTSDIAAKETRILGLRNFYLSKYRDLLTLLYQQDKQLTKKEVICNTSINILLSLIRPLLIAFVALQTLGHFISVGQFYLYTQAIGQLESSFSSLMVSLAQLHENNLFLMNLNRFLELSADVEAPRSYIQSPIGLSPPIPQIEFRNVSFYYPNTAVKVLDNLSFCINSGESIALVGNNGSGKTTIVNLLSGLYRPTEGTILLNGVDIDSLSREDLRATLGIVVQDYSIYHFSIADNIGIGFVNEIGNFPRISAIAQRSGLKHLIDNLPDGYDTILGRWIERGHELSGGQRQLVALARVLMRNAPILVLDEPSAALDIHNEVRFFREILESHKENNRTVIFISHRFSTVRQADRILLLEKGRLIEQGSHHELMKLKGHYADMFALQIQMYGDPLETPLPPNSVATNK
jgi:ATP-binding cassette subfamily B protein